MNHSTALLSALILLTACTDEDQSSQRRADVVSVMPMVETTSVISEGDAAGDPAIWVNAKDPAKSLVIGTDKKSGLIVYNLDGQIVHQNSDGRMNKVDVRGGYPITTNNGDPATATPTIIVAATNRTSKEISVYAMNPEAGVLTNILVEPIPSNFDEPYGLCLYRSAVNGNLYVYATDTEGTVSQWQLYDNGLGKLRATIQRTWPVGRKADGCVADDANGWVFISEEAAGIWRYGAEPKDSFNERVSIDVIGFSSTGGHLSAGGEGLSIYMPEPAQDKTQGYLVASSQGNFSYVVYDRAPPHASRGTFQVIDNTALDVDGSQQAGDLDVVSANLGPNFPAGLLVTQGGYTKTSDGAAAGQNFKYASWADVAEALGLE